MRFIHKFSNNRDISRNFNFMAVSYFLNYEAFMIIPNLASNMHIKSDYAGY